MLAPSIIGILFVAGLCVLLSLVACVDVKLFEDQEVTGLFITIFGVLLLLVAFVSLLLRVLVGDLFVDDLDRILEHDGQLKDSRIVHMQLIQLQDEPLAYFIDSEVVPLAPGPVISELFLLGLVVLRFDILELLHEL